MLFDTRLVHNPVIVTPDKVQNSARETLGATNDFPDFSSEYAWE